MSPRPPASPAVEVIDLVKAYGARRAVDGLSLCVPRGRVLAMLGPNGAGKTTTVEICEGFRRADSGTVRVLGLDPAAPALRPRVGVMLQDGVGGYTGATALELLRLFAAYAAHPQQPADLLEIVGLAEVGGTAVKRLSGGQQQRLSLALALVARPELVFLDEPTSGMDPQARRGTWDLVRSLRADGVTVVLTTHFLDEAEQLADTVVVIDAGRIVAAGQPGRADPVRGRGPDPVPGRAGAAARLAGGRPARGFAGHRARARPLPRHRRGHPAAARHAHRLVRGPAGDGRGAFRSSAAPSRTSSSTSPVASCAHERREVEAMSVAPAGRFTPAPAAAPLARMLAAQTAMEFKLLLRNAEQVGLTLLIPLLLLFFFNLPLLYSLGAGPRIDFVVPSIITLAVMSAAFTGLAIGTGFERKYAVLKRLGATALPRSVLIGGKTAAVLLLEVVQLVLICGLGFALAWHPHGDPLLALLLVVLGTVAFGGLGLLVAGTLRAEVTLAAANLIWLVLLFAGGIAIPLSKYGGAARDVLQYLPSAALSDGLHAVLQHGDGLPLRETLTLLVWAAVALPAAARWFRWE